jgi:hypothetical protein
VQGDGRIDVLRIAAHWAATVLLVAVALNQIRLAWLEQTLAPDKGGGFGLFSTVDKLYNRSLFAYAIREDGESPIRIGATPLFDHTLRTAQSWPSQRHLEAVAHTLASELRHVPLAPLRVEVWRRSYDARDGRVTRAKVAETIVPGGGPARDR